MTDYIFSNLSNGQVITGFNVSSDVLIFGTVTGGAAAIGLTESGGSTTFTVGGKAITLSGVTVNQLTTSNVTLAGAVFVAGDNTTSSDLDDLAQGAGGVLVTVPGSGGDYILGRGGNDVINGQGGADFVNGNQGNDTITVDADEGLDTLRGGADNDSIDGSAGTVALQVFGDNGADTIIGGTGADFLQGNAGNDSIHNTGVTSVGNDTVRGGAGNDVINYDAANSTSGNPNLWGDLGNDTITGSDQADTIYGGNPDDATADDGADNIDGNSGNDVIFGNGGADTITDGAGLDTVRAGKDGDRINTHVADADDLFYGDLGDDTIVAGAGDNGDDTIFGGEGDDSIDLSAGTTSGITASGDAGDDTFVLSANGVATVGHTVTGGAGSDTFNVYIDNNGTDVHTITDFNGAEDTIALTTDDLNAAGLEIQMTSSGLTLEDDANGGIGDDERLVITTSGSGAITVTNAANSLTSLVAFNNSGTAASITGGSGADYLISGDAGDTITTGAGADVVVAGAGDDLVIQDTTGGDTANGGLGTDTLQVAGTTAINVGDAAADNNYGFESITFSGTGARQVNLVGTLVVAGDIAASDTVTINGTGYAGAITVTDSGAGAGVKLDITGGDGADNIVVDANTSTSTINGGAGTDTVTGGVGADSLSGGDGNDTITGGSTSATAGTSDGIDTLTGGAGNDQFVFVDDDAIDRVTDYTVGADDLVISIGAFDTELAAGQIVDGNGADEAAGAAVVRSLASGDSITGVAGENIFKFTNTTGINAVSDLSYQITLGGAPAAATDVIVGIYYDADDARAVLFHMNEDATGDSIVASAADTTVEFAYISMSAADYTALASGDFLFIA